MWRKFNYIHIHTTGKQVYQYFHAGTLYVLYAEKYVQITLNTVRDTFPEK